MFNDTANRTPAALKPNSQGQPDVFREHPRHGCRGAAHKDVLVAVPEGDWLHRASAMIHNAGGPEE